jgi:cystathionine beta-lyase/cystathionine gamma-synthase
MNPVAYMPTNSSTIIGEDGNASGDSTVSNCPTTSITTLHSSTPKVFNDRIAPLTVPHLFWRCTVSGPADTTLITFTALIDDGSHIVLIRDCFARSLQLKRRTLPTPMPIEMAMPGESSKRTIKLSEYVKLRLYDPSNYWTYETV